MHIVSTEAGRLFGLVRVLLSPRAIEYQALVIPGQHILSSLLEALAVAHHGILLSSQSLEYLGRWNNIQLPPRLSSFVGEEVPQMLSAHFHSRKKSAPTMHVNSNQRLPTIWFVDDAAMHIVQDLLHFHSSHMSALESP